MVSDTNVKEMLFSDDSPPHNILVLVFILVSVFTASSYYIQIAYQLGQSLKKCW